MNFNILYMEFGVRLKKILKQKKISQVAFSERINIHTGLLSRYLNGEKPSVEFIYKVLKELPDLDLYYLFGDVIKENDKSDIAIDLNEDTTVLIEQMEKKLQKLRDLVAE